MTDKKLFLNIQLFADGAGESGTEECGIRNSEWASRAFNISSLLSILYSLKIKKNKEERKKNKEKKLFLRYFYIFRKENYDG